MNSNSNGMLKPACIALSAVVLDKILFGTENIQSSLLFGAVCGAGSWTAELIAPTITPDIPMFNQKMANSKIVGERMVELGISSVGVFALNKYVLNNDPYKNEMGYRMLTVAASDVLGTYLSEYIDSKPLQFLE